MPAASILADLAHGLRGEWRAFSWRSPRALLALRPVLSVLIAVAAAHALGLHDAWWAAIIAFMVMQADFGASFHRGVLRIAGTLCGAALGFVPGPVGTAHPFAFVARVRAAGGRARRDRCAGRGAAGLGIAEEALGSQQILVTRRMTGATS